MNGQMDLKFARLFIRDGYTNAGSVNLTAGYAVGLTSMAVADIVGIIQNGTIFTAVGDDTEYEVIAHTETSSNTTAITFTPGLVEATVDNQVLTFHPHQIEVRIGEGNFTYSVKKERQYKKNRGRLDTVRDGDEQQLEVNFDFVWDHVIGSTDDPVNIEEALEKIGNAANWVSTSDACEPYAVDLLFVFEPVCSGEEGERYLFEDFRHESLDHNAKDGTIACKGACNRTLPTITRVAAA